MIKIWQMEGERKKEQSKILEKNLYFHLINAQMLTLLSPFIVIILPHSYAIKRCEYNNNTAKVKNAIKKMNDNDNRRRFLVFFLLFSFFFSRRIVVKHFN